LPFLQPHKAPKAKVCRFRRAQPALPECLLLPKMVGRALGAMFKNWAEVLNVGVKKANNSLKDLHPKILEK
jgi:hypothetical protein